MEPLFSAGDVLLVTGARRKPDRGRVVVVAMPLGTCPRWQIKRVVGLPGDRLTLDGGLLFINGTHYPEPYLKGLPRRSRNEHRRLGRGA